MRSGQRSNVVRRIYSEGPLAPGSNHDGVSRQLVPLALVVGAGLADAAGRPSLSFYLLLAAIPVVVAVALSSYGDVVAGEGGSAGRTALWTLVLVGLVATAALPSLDPAALTACLILVGIQAVTALSADLRREPAAK
jgi:hypothetical protein